MDEAKTFMTAEEQCDIRQTKAQMLYPAIVQDAAELLMNIAVPVQKTQQFTTSEELFKSGESQQVSLPDWTKPIVNVSNFLHFFRGDARLPQKLLNEVFTKTTKAHFKHHLDNVVVVRKVPSAHLRYTRTWIMERLLSILTMHQARIIDPQRDIHVMPDQEDPENFHSVVIYLDNFSHLRVNDTQGDDDAESDIDD